MTISAKVLAHSITTSGAPPIFSMQLRYPRFIHAEVMTHRVFSRNASSSRAIPVERLIEDIIRDPVYPSFWGSNKPGMQAGEECFNLVECGIPEISWDHNGYEECSYIETIFYKEKREYAWDMARDNAIQIARAFANAGYHKQIVNRLLEPFSHINVVVTSTDWNNFFALRRHPDAQPEIRILADAIWEAQQASTPKLLQYGEWHLPYITQLESDGALDVATLIKISAARCARTSYLTHDGAVPSIDADIALYEKLAVSTPLHASPCEHQATPDTFDRQDIVSQGYPRAWGSPELHGNFTGWIQHRKTLPDEYIK